MRCSSVSGESGRSRQTRRLANWKLRPSLETLAGGDLGLQGAERFQVPAEHEDLLVGASQAPAKRRRRLELATLGEVLTPQHASGERSDLHPAIADEPRRKAVASGDVLEQARARHAPPLPGAASLDRRREHGIVRSEPVELPEGFIDVAAGEQLARDAGERLMGLEAGQESF